MLSRQSETTSVADTHNLPRVLSKASAAAQNTRKLMYRKGVKMKY